MGSRSLPRTVGIYAMTLHSEECRGWISSRRAYRLINRLSFRPVYSRTWWKERSDNNARLRTKSLSIAHLNSGIIPALLLLSDPLPSLSNGCYRKRSLSLFLSSRNSVASILRRWTFVEFPSFDSRTERFNKVFLARNETKRNVIDRSWNFRSATIRFDEELERCCSLIRDFVVESSAEMRWIMEFSNGRDSIEGN